MIHNVQSNTAKFFTTTTTTATTITTTTATTDDGGLKTPKHVAFLIVINYKEFCCVILNIVYHIYIIS
jgi:hypothetical protein